MACLEFKILCIKENGNCVSSKIPRVLVCEFKLIAVKTATMLASLSLS